MRRSRVLAWTAVAGAAAAAVAWTVRDLPAAFGSQPTGERADRVRRSAQYRDGAFRNTVQTRTVPGQGGGRNMLREMMFEGARRRPPGQIPVVRPSVDGPRDGLHITWYGHASTLVEIEGRRVLIDPIWSDRCSPSRLVGPRRRHPVPLPLEELPALDAIVISHDHYDHLDMASIRRLAQTQNAPFVVPLGVGAHLDRWGIPAARIIELDWGQHTEVGGLRLTATAARHFSGRTLRRDYTLWGSWVIAGPTRKVFYSGDSGYFDGYARIGEQYGPFDATLIQVGAYDVNWPDIHMTPEEGLAAHQDVRGGLLIPVHWCTFTLAFHPWGEPADRVWREAKAQGVPLAVPRPGERIDVDDPPAVDGWWQTLA